MLVSCGFEPRDMWIGFFYKPIKVMSDGYPKVQVATMCQLYFCPVPMLYIKFVWLRPPKEGEADETDRS